MAYAKEDRNQEAVEILEKAVADTPNNPSAQRNLGACLVAVNEVERGIQCLLRATELNPKDQQAFWGLAEAYRVAGNLDDADPTYQKVVAIDEFSQLAQQAKEQLSWLAHVGFLMRGGGVGRSDAVMYCLAALKQFDGLPEEEVQKVVFEIAMLGTKGFEINDTAEKYQLRSMPGKFSGLHLVCIMYTGFQQIAPELPPLFDLAKEYAVAKKMFEDSRGGK